MFWAVSVARVEKRSLVEPEKWSEQFHFTRKPNSTHRISDQFLYKCIILRPGAGTVTERRK